MSIEANLNKVKTRIADACAETHRSVDEMTLVAASKSQDVETIRQAFGLGQIHFAENYLQEAVQKIEALAKENLVWHFIGAIQANKTRDIAENFSWVHTVSREKIAIRLNEQRSPHLPPLNVCVQVNVSEEPQKSGLSMAEVKTFLPVFDCLKNLKLRGLMVIPEFSENKESQAAVYQQAQKLYTQLIEAGWLLDTLSMGMSHDLEAAIAYGSTMVRIGTAIFGERK